MQVGFSSTLSLTDTEVFPHGLMKMARYGQDCVPKAPHFFGFCWFQDTCHRPRATTKRCTPMIPWYRAAQNNHHISSVPLYPSACLLRTAVGPKSGSISSHLTHTNPTKFWLRHNLDSLLSIWRLARWVGGQPQRRSSIIRLSEWS